MAIAEAGDASSVGRPHIAKAAGVDPEGMSAFFEEWLVPGAKAFVSRRWPHASEAVEIIHGAGGVAVLAHPFWDTVRQGVASKAIEMRRQGFVGASMRPMAESAYARIAERLAKLDERFTRSVE